MIDAVNAFLSSILRHLAPTEGPADPQPIRPIGGLDRVPADVYAWALTGVAILSIWVSVALATIFAPDFVSGSQQEHLPLVGWLDWIWGIVATSFVMLAAVQGIRAGVAKVAPWVVLAVGVAVTWAMVALITAFAPVFVTGTDPTRIPLAALGIPILGAFPTWFICTLVRAGFEQ